MCEGGAADTAGEGWLVGVGRHVTPEAGSIPEGEGTIGACVGLFAAVPPLVRPLGVDSKMCWVSHKDRSTWVC